MVRQLSSGSDNTRENGNMERSSSMRKSLTIEGE